VWRGALVLSDFILDNEELFKDCYALELGSGVGLSSITLSRFAKRVFLTGRKCLKSNLSVMYVDYDSTILQNAQRNATTNCVNESTIKCRKYDWTSPPELSPGCLHFDWGIHSLLKLCSFVYR
jgi:predicted nicotinamide N-methyase